MNVSKKFIVSFAAACIMALALTACSESENASSAPEQPVASQTENASQQEPQVAEQKAAEQKTEDKKQAEDKTLAIGETFDVADFSVTVTSAEKVKDFEGNDALLVKLNWTNNSDKTTAPGFDLSFQAFQSGKQIDLTTISSDKVDGIDSWTEARPGTTLENVYMAFKLDSDEPVELEVSQMIDFSGKKPVVVKLS